MLRPLTVSDTFSFATCVDILMLLLGTVCALAQGASFPLMIIMFGDILGTIGASGMADTDVFLKEMETILMRMLMIGGGVWVVAFVKSWCWGHAGARMAVKAREAYLRSIMRQDVGWFDTEKVLELPSRVVELTENFQTGVSQSGPPEVIVAMGTFVGGISMSFGYK